MHISRKKKMYVLVRKDLDETYGVVQGCHAVAEYSLRGDKTLYDKWNNGTLVFLGIPHLGALGFW